MGPNEVDVKDLASLPNASEKDAAAPAIQKYAEPGKKQVSRAKFWNTLFHHWITMNSCFYLSCCQKCLSGPISFVPVHMPTCMSLWHMQQLAVFIIVILACTLHTNVVSHTRPNHF